jgi:hypothetical protein
LLELEFSKKIDGMVEDSFQAGDGQTLTELASVPATISRLSILPFLEIMNSTILFSASFGFCFARLTNESESIFAEIQFRYQAKQRAASFNNAVGG